MAQQLLRHAPDDDDEDDVTHSSTKPIDVDFNTNTDNNNGDEGGGGGGGGGGGVTSGGKTARLPRWTRQEILVLIQGKRVAENRVRRGRTIAICEQQGGQQEQQQVQVEPKWATVSSYCKRHGVNRGPVQCRKRWSNLAGDFKKIKEWDSHIQDESESFWLMRNDVRRERKLPGFFDREVFDILNSNTQVDQRGQATVDDALVFDSGRTAAADDGLFSDFEQQEKEQERERERGREQEQEQGEEIERRSSTGNEADVEVHVMAPPLVSPIPISEKQYQPMSAEATGPETNQGKQQAGFQPEIGSTSGEGRKRRRVLAEEEGEGQDELVQVLEKNGRVLSAQLDAYNINLKLDREERKDHATSLVAVLNKLADALGRIADKL